MLDGWRGNLHQWPAQTFGDLQTKQPPARRDHRAAVLKQFRFLQDVDHVAAHAGGPVQAVILVQQELALAQRSIHANGGADQTVDMLQIRMGAAFILEKAV